MDAILVVFGWKYVTFSILYVRIELGSNSTWETKIAIEEVNLFYTNQWEIMKSKSGQREAHLFFFYRKQKGGPFFIFAAK